MEILQGGNWENTEHFIGLALFIIIGILGVFIFFYANRVRDLRNSLHRLVQSFNELDEQAKLIVQTDLELNKTQDVLDKRLNGLDTLQKTSRLVSTTLDENEIFQRLNEPFLTELGFEKYFLLMPDDKNRLQACVNIGFPSQDMETLTSQLQQNKKILRLLKEEGLLSSARLPEDIKEAVVKTFDVNHFVISPLIAKEDLPGILLAANPTNGLSVSEGDEEMISILADQISQSVKNARLFEQVYRSSQMLETKVQERTKQLSSVLSEVQKISKAKSEFISAVSHELRTPLTSIKGYASILITGKVGNIPDAVKERLEKINKHSDNLVKLINDLLDISRIESGRAEMKFVEREIGGIVENVRDLLAPQMKEKEIQFIAEIPEQTPLVFMDPGQIERVLINLIGNAIKFTPANGSITVRAEKDVKKITVHVSDTGIGITEEDVEHLFDEFYRVDNEINQSVKGSGLGLALTKKIVQAHDGDIWVDSEKQKGATFSFTLPIERDPAYPARQKKT